MNKYLELLPIVADRGWRVRTDGAIRDKDGRCPLCALAHEVSGGEVDFYDAYFGALDNAGFTDLIDCEPIARAADFPSAKLRAQLKAALGMKP